MTKTYYRKSRTSKRGFFFLLIMIMLGVFIAFNIADIVSSFIIGKGSIFYNGNMYISSKTFYAISCGNFLGRSDAVKMSDQVSSKGGAGYVYLSGDYYVLLSMYASQMDANSVKEKLKSDNIDAKIINVNIPNLKIKFSDKDKNLTKASKEFLSAFDFLYEMSVEYDSGGVTFEQCKISILQKIAELDYIKKIEPSTKEGLCVKNKALKMIEILKNLSMVEKSGYLFNSAVKYAYFEIVFDYISMCKSISWFFGQKLLKCKYERIHRNKRTKYC